MNRVLLLFVLLVALAYAGKFAMPVGKLQLGEGVLNGPTWHFDSPRVRGLYSKAYC